MKKFFWITYAILIVALAITGYAAVSHVNKVLTEYELSQPERLVEQQIKLIKEATQSDTLENIIAFYDLDQAEYDKELTVFKEYREKLAEAKELTYKVKAGYSETGQLFQVLADEEPVAVIELESIKEEKKLAILTVSDWKVKSITPVMTLVNYEYVINAPEGFRVLVNGYEMKDAELKEGLKVYHLAKLYSEPEITIYDTYGFLVEYDIVDSVVTPVVHTYTVRLPKSFSVYVGETKADGTEKDGEMIYSITTACEELKLTDTYGNSINHIGDDSIYIYSYEFSIPENYHLTLNSEDSSEYITESFSVSKYQYCEEYVSMPKQVTYKIENSICELPFEIYDNIGQKVDYVMTNGKVEITEQTGLEEIPAEVAAEIDVLDMAKTWSKFMTNDLSGDKNGFGTIKNYLIKDSYMYNVAYKWATGIDITFTSAHRTEDNYFTDENVTNYIKYSNDLFSCDISFVKHMYLYKKNKYVEDETNSTFYFLRQGEGDTAHWVILDIQEVISK